MPMDWIVSVLNLEQSKGIFVVCRGGWRFEDREGDGWFLVGRSVGAAYVMMILINLF